MLPNLIIKKSINLRARRYSTAGLFTRVGKLLRLRQSEIAFHDSCLVSGNAEIWWKIQKAKIKNSPGYPPGFPH